MSVVNLLAALHCRATKQQVCMPVPTSGGPLWVAATLEDLPTSSGQLTITELNKIAKDISIHSSTT